MTWKTPIAAIAVLVCALGVLSASAAGHDRPDGLDAARAGTARFHQVAHAEDAGYGLLLDAAGIACIDNPGVGGMGDHYVNGALVADALVDAGAPEALVYQPLRNGRLRLVAAEYIAFRSVWDAAHDAPPALFGRRFELVDAPNRFGLPAFYELHAWIWKHNPRGLFDDWNPRVTCASG